MGGRAPGVAAAAGVAAAVAAGGGPHWQYNGLEDGNDDAEDEDENEDQDHPAAASGASGRNPRPSRGG